MGYTCFDLFFVNFGISFFLKSFCILKYVYKRLDTSKKKWFKKWFKIFLLFWKNISICKINLSLNKILLLHFGLLKSIAYVCFQNICCAWQISRLQSTDPSCRTFKSITHRPRSQMLTFGLKTTAHSNTKSVTKSSWIIISYYPYYFFYQIFSFF